MIDLMAAYDEMDRTLQRFGLGAAPYMLTVEVWNHRHDDQKSTVTFQLSVHLGHEVVMVYAAPSLAEGLRRMELKLTERVGAIRGETPLDAVDVPQ